MVRRYSPKWLKSIVKRDGKNRSAWIGFGAVIWFDDDNWQAEKDGRLIGHFKDDDDAKALIQKGYKYGR